MAFLVRLQVKQLLKGLEVKSRSCLTCNQPNANMHIKYKNNWLITNIDQLFLHLRKGVLWK